MKHAVLYSLATDLFMYYVSTLQKTEALYIITYISFYNRDE
jgi:hypothetical protein